MILGTNTNTLYQIRRKYDGMLSRGGDDPKFGKTGRVWNGSGPLKNHLRSMMKDYRGHDTDDLVRKYYRGCEVVAVAIVVKGGETASQLPDPVPVLQLVSEMREKDKVNR